MDKKVETSEISTASFDAAAAFYGALDTGDWHRIKRTGGLVEQMDRRKHWTMIRKFCNSLDAYRWVANSGTVLFSVVWVVS
jgi:hypothetical protein